MNEIKYKNIFVQGAIEPQFIADSIAKHQSKKNIGAHSIFLGQVRNDIVNQQEVTAIDYTAYEEMALKKMHEIREEIFAKYNLTCMHIYHSLGVVATGQISLFVFTSSKRRADAIHAAEEVVEKIKKELPVWGKEILTDSNSSWKRNNVS